LSLLGQGCRFFCGRTDMRLLTRALLVACTVSGSITYAEDPKPTTTTTVVVVPLSAGDEKGDGKKAEEQPDPNEAYQKMLAQQAKAIAELGKTASHKPLTTVEIKPAASGVGLQTLTLDTEGNVLALVAPPRYFNAVDKGAASEVRKYSPDGKPLGAWAVDFHAHALNAAPDGTVYVAGDGKVARFDKSGKAVSGPVELPFVADLLKDKDALRKKAEENLKQQKEQIVVSLKKVKKQFEDQVKKIEAKAEDDRTKTEKRQLQQAKAILKSYEQSEEYYTKRTVEDVLTEMTSRLRIVNGIAASETDVFVACGESEGFGYGVWRMSRDVTGPKKVLGGIGGCCGQMDIQVQGADLLVAENTKHQFARYDRDGKKLGTFGKRGQDTDPACFGGCCNPMNLRACGTGGDIFTAESEGIVKRFSPEGKYLGTAAAVTVNGGCKNVAVAVNADASRIYFCDQPGGKFFILAKPAAAK